LIERKIKKEKKSATFAYPDYFIAEIKKKFYAEMANVLSRRTLDFATHLFRKLYFISNSGWSVNLRAIEVCIFSIRSKNVK
jgi:hypothetical protein